MYSAVRSADKRTPYVVNLVADSDSDIESLPTHYAAGSTCLAIDSSTTYVLNHDKEWTAISSSSSDSSGSSSSGDTIDIGLATEDQIDSLFDSSSSSDDTEVEASLATEEDIDALFE